MMQTRVAHRQRLLLVVGDQDEGDADVALQVLQLDLHVAAQLAVERRQRLVEQQHGRPVDQRAGQRDALLLAAGQLPDAPRARSPAGAPARAPRRRACRARPVEPGRALAQPVGDVVRDVEMREQRVVLEHHVDRPPVGRHADHRLARRSRPRPRSAARSRRSGAAQVVLPQPDGPRKEWNEPRGISNEMASTATTAPNRLVTPRNSTSTGALAARVAAAAFGSANEVTPTSAPCQPRPSRWCTAGSIPY